MVIPAVPYIVLLLISLVSLTGAPAGKIAKAQAAAEKACGVQVEDYIQGFTIQDVPLTQHAGEAHQNRTWSAKKIQALFSTFACTPAVSKCGNVLKMVCALPLSGFKSCVGLVIGFASGEARIVTGFQGSCKLWFDQDGRDKCGDWKPVSLTDQLTLK